MKSVEQSLQRAIYPMIHLRLANTTCCLAVRPFIKVSSLLLIRSLNDLCFILAVSNWRYHQSSSMAKNDPRDFKKLNKMSLHMNATTA